MTDNKELIAKMECEVYEAITGKCAHVLAYKGRKGNWILVDGKKGWMYKCSKCKKPLNDMPNNPPLATSLDAWAKHIWPAMDERILLYALELLTITDPKWVRGDNGCIELITGELALFMMATPLYHLEAACRMLGIWTEADHEVS